MFTKITNFLTQKKTYIVAFGALVTAYIQYIGYEIPEIVWAIEAFLGVAAIKAGSIRIEEELKKMNGDK